MTKKKILLGLTTTPGSDWRAKTKEIDKLNIEEIALFPTFIKKNERKELYKLLEKTKLKTIPHVHLRTEDMDIAESDYLKNRWNVKVFNIHSPREHPVNFNYSKYKVYLENTHFIPTEKEIEKYDGLCIDFSHWEGGLKIKNEKYYKEYPALVKKYPIGCAHISAVSNKLVHYSYCDPAYDNHIWNGDYKELDYIKKYIKFIPDIVSIELMNSFEEQLKVKKYLDKIING